IEPVLLPVRLRLDEQHFFCKAIRSIRFLRIAVPQVFFLEWDGRQLRVCADRTDGHELLDAVPSAVFHELHAHHKIVVKEASGIGPVSAYATDITCEMNYNVGA